MSRFARSALLQQPVVGLAAMVTEAAKGISSAWNSDTPVRATRPVVLPLIVPLVPLTSCSGIAVAVLDAGREMYVRPPMFCMTCRSSCTPEFETYAQGYLPLSHVENTAL
jgi:hypothetical protein